ncbi:Hypothetical predicted protein [Olea europaea subsp. europaea]|uniref:Uncharacterized protein n=1 Tax=Olea europaea subsp. europaea TaxID=158383 RepID=A0A8S0PA09_OLEEU|nr:Hypothetical predicted protein [Olea europaea subsp. europaea]
MNFESLVPENASLRGHISQRSNLHIEHIQPCPDNHPVPVPTKKCKPKGATTRHLATVTKSRTCYLLESNIYTVDIEPCPDNDPMPVPARTNEVQGIPSFIEN